MVVVWVDVLDVFVPGAGLRKGHLAVGALVGPLTGVCVLVVLQVVLLVEPPSAHVAAERAETEPPTTAAASK